MSSNRKWSREQVEEFVRTVTTGQWNGDREIKLFYDESGQKVVREERGVLVPWAFSPAVLWAVMRTATHLAPVAEAVALRKNQILQAETSTKEKPDGEVGVGPEHPRYAAIMQQFAGLLMEKVDVQIHPLPGVEIEKLLARENADRVPANLVRYLTWLVE